MDERERVLLTLAGVRVFMGVFWLVNLLWRLPTELREGQLLGPPAHVRARPHARLHAAGAQRRRPRPHPPHDRRRLDRLPLGLFTGLSLLLGLWTRVGAVLGLLQAIAITLLVANAPGVKR